MPGNQELPKAEHKLTHYELLGISQEELDEITPQYLRITVDLAFKRVASRNFPKSIDYNPKKEKILKQAGNAREILGHPNRRKLYTIIITHKDSKLRAKYADITTPMLDDAWRCALIKLRQPDITSRLKEYGISTANDDELLDGIYANKDKLDELLEKLNCTMEDFLGVDPGAQRVEEHKLSEDQRVEEHKLSEAQTAFFVFICIIFLPFTLIAIAALLAIKGVSYFQRSEAESHSEQHQRSMEPHRRTHHLAIEGPDTNLEVEEVVPKEQQEQRQSKQGIE